MVPIRKDSECLENLTDGQIEDLIKSNEALDQEEANWIKDEKEEAQRKEGERENAKDSFRRLRKAPLEIVSRSLFWFFLGSFLFSFVSVYSASSWWFFWYLISAGACIFYPPNGKALKELLDAWPNIMDLIKSQRK